jgi:FolB domain-containing protein
MSTEELTFGMDRILIRDLLVRCILGLNDDERREKQDVVINLVLYADLNRAGTTDCVQDSVNYRDVKKRVLAAAESSSYHLVEALAERVAAVCLEFTRVARVQVTVEKPSALRFARSVGVELTRERKT